MSLVRAFGLAASAGLVSVSVSAYDVFDSSNKVIYGEDGRRDLYEVTSPDLQRLADSTVALFKTSKIRYSWLSKHAKLTLNAYSDAKDLCEGEAFRDQLSGAFCSGALVGEDLVLTAGHCVTSESDCAETSFVFGFNTSYEGHRRTKVLRSDVYGCKNIVARAQDNEGADFALVRLDAKVSGHSPLGLNRTGVEVTVGTPLVVVGHPSGLPVKITEGGTVRDASPEEFFVASTDTYAGNSGSPVFNAETGLIEGVLVRGERDFVPTENACNVSYRCSEDGCRGEDVTKVSAFAALL